MGIFRKISKWFKKKQKSGEQAVSNVVKTVSSGASNVGKAISSSVAKQRKNAVENLKDENKAKWGDAFNPKTNSVRSAFKTAIKNSSPVKDWKDWNKQGGYKGSGGYSKKAQDVSQSATFEAKRHPYAYSAAKGAAKGTSVGLFDLVESQQDAKHKQQTALTDKYVSKHKGAKALGTATEVAGNLASFGAANSVTRKLGEKVLASHAGDTAKAAETLAKSSLFKKAAARAAEKTGVAAEDIATRYAKNVISGIAADASMNATLGNLQALGQASKTKGDLKDKAKNYAENMALNAGLGAGIEVAPYALKALKNKGIENAVTNAADNTVKGIADRADVVLKNGDAENAAKALNNNTEDAASEAEKEAKKAVENLSNSNTNAAAVRAKADAKKYSDLDVRRAEGSGGERAKLAVNNDSGGFTTNAKASNLNRLNAKIARSDVPDVPTVATDAKQLVVKADAKAAKREALNAVTDNADNAAKAAVDNVDDASKVITDAETLKANAEAEAKQAVKKRASEFSDIPVSGKNTIDEPKADNFDEFVNQKSNGVESGNVYDNATEDALTAQEENKIRLAERRANGTISKNNGQFTDIPSAKQLNDSDYAFVNAKAATKGEVDDIARTSEKMSAKLGSEEGVSKSAETQMKYGTGISNDSIKEGMETGDYNYFVKHSTTKKLDAAIDAVTKDPNGVANSLQTKLKNGDAFVVDDILKCAALNRYCERIGHTAGAEFTREFETAYSIEVGQLFQAMNAYRKLSPEGRVRAVERSIDRMCQTRGFNPEELKATLGDKYDDLLQQVRNSGTDEELQEAQKNIFNAIREQMPESLLETFNTWRYLSMLGNPKTHVRNVVGNVVFAGTRSISDAFSAALQKHYLNTSQIDYVSRSVLNPKELADAMSGKGSIGKKIAEYAAEDTEALIGSSSKYGVEKGGAKRNILQSGINKLSEGNGFLLNKEDEAFVNFNYKKSFAEFLKANGYGTGKIASHFESEEALVNAARSFAQEDALEATFRDMNSLADGLNRFVRNGMSKNANLGHKAAAWVANVNMPFTNTPMNIMKQAVNFSPVGLMNGIRKLKNATTPGEINNACESLSRGLTGTSILALGMWLGTRDENNKIFGVLPGISLSTQASDGYVDKFNKRLGYQDYSLVTGGKDHASYTLDWLTPISSCLFAGAEIGKQLKNNGTADEINGWDRIATMSMIAGRVFDPLLNTTMLQGINNTLDNASSDSKSSALLNVIGATANNYISSAVPTLLGQISRTIAPYAYDTVSDASSEGGQTNQSFALQQVAKIPGLSKKVLAPKVDMYGNIVDEKKSGKDYAKSALENFISPSYRQKITKTKTDEKLIKLYNDLVANGMDAQTAKQVLPDIDYKFDKVISSTDGKERKYGLKREEMHMTRAERAKYLENRSKTGQERLANLMFNNAAFNASGARATQTEKQAMQNATGQSMKSALATLVNSRQYKAAAPEDRKSMILEVLGITKSRNNTALKELYMNRGNSEADYYVKANLSAGKQAAIRDQGLDKILTNEQIMDFAESASKNKYSDSESTNGQLFKNFNKSSMLAYLNSDAAKDLTSEQKAALYNLFKRSNAKSYGSSGSGKGYHKRRKHYSSGGSSKTKTAKIKASKFKATKQSYKSATSGNSFASKKSSVDLQMSASQQAALRKLLKNSQKGE